MEKVTDFSQCKFIKENMWFFTYYDFCDNRKLIKNLFESLDQNGKMFYMWYVYSNVRMDEKFKNAIWDYLNFDDPEYLLNLINLKKSYRVK